MLNYLLFKEMKKIKKNKFNKMDKETVKVLTLQRISKNYSMKKKRSKEHQQILAQLYLKDQNLWIFDLNLLQKRMNSKLIQTTLKIYIVINIFDYKLLSYFIDNFCDMENGRK